MIKNKFIVVEGLEGSGKTNACNCIKNVLHQYNIKNVILVRQPGGTPIAEKIRKIIKNKFNSEECTKKTELLLVYAARVQLIEKIIKPALQKGDWVISDRHDLSSLAYQGGGLGIDQSLILQLKNSFIGKFVPDLTVYLDVFPEIGLKRILNRQALDRIEKRSLHFFKRTRLSYLKNLSLDKKIIKINANLNISNVTYNIKKKISNWIKKQMT